MDNRLTVLVPCRNEEVTIERKIKDLLKSTKDIYKVIIVDDYSSDQTAKIVKNLVKKYQKLTYLKNSFGKGKASAIRAGIKQARTDLIAITDADVWIEAGSLKKMIKQFNKPEVGMVGADLKSIKKNLKTGRMNMAMKLSDELFHRIRLFLSRVDSLPLLHMQLVVIRKSIGVYPRIGIRADDVDTAIRMRLRGYKTILAPNAWFLQTVSDKDDFTKRLRRDGGTIATLWQYRYLLFNLRYGKYGLICFPVCFGLYFIQPFLVILFLLLPWLFLSNLLKAVYFIIILNVESLQKLVFYDVTLILAIVKTLFSKGTVVDSWSTVRKS